MNTFEALRREIEVRLWRQTIYKAVDALNSKTSLADEIKSNNDMIQEIADFIRTKTEGQEDWELYLAEKRKEGNPSLQITGG